MRVICTKMCVYGGRRYRVGEWMPTPQDGIVPPHFSYTPKTLSKNWVEGSPGGPLPTNHSGRVLLVADAPSLDEWTGRAQEFEGVPVAAVNRAGIRWPANINFWLTVHPIYFAAWTKKRRDVGLYSDNITYISKACVYNPDSVIVVRDADSGGSSSLFAVKILFRMGFEHIDTRGLELDGKYKQFRVDWERYAEAGTPGTISAPGGFIKELFSCQVK